MEPSHRSSDETEPERTAGQRALRNLGLLVGAIALTVVGGLGAGWLYAKGSPQRAASTVVGQFVEREDSLGEEPPPEGVVAPTSGRWTDGTPRCGWSSEPVSVDDQLATLATGAVIVQFDPAVVRELDVLEQVATRDDVLVVPNPALDSAVVGTAWTQRMQLPAPTAELLFAFVTAHTGVGPEASATCPVVEGD